MRKEHHAFLRSPRGTTNLVYGWSEDTCLLLVLFGYGSFLFMVSEVCIDGPG